MFEDWVNERQNDGIVEVGREDGNTIPIGRSRMLEGLICGCQTNHDRRSIE